LASPPNSKSGQTPPLAYPHARTNLRNETNFYDQRFDIGFTAQEKTDLLAFLSAL
jgi:hypothetical protein